MNKLVNVDSEIILKRNELSSHENKRRQNENVNKKLHDFTDLTFWKRQKYEESKKISGCQVSGQRDG